MELRKYQADCVGAIWAHMQASVSPAVAVLPTGAGKSLVAAQIARDVVGWGGRMAVLSHVKELVQQVHEHITELSGVTAGIYSAGLGAKETGYPVTVAGIQSAFKKAADFGKLDVILVDEAHRIPTDGEGQYRTFLDGAREVNPDARLVGLTATPFRTGTGYIYGEGQLFERVCYSIGVRELIVGGYLSPLKSKATHTQFDTENVTIRGGEFVQGELQSAVMADTDKVALACMEIASKTADRKSVIVFASGVEHGKQVAEFLRDQDCGLVGEIYGDTHPDQRAGLIKDFRSGRLKYLVNVEVLTTGFDAPGVDCISLLRPTMSPGLHYQMIGRGLRKAPHKADCLVLDFGGNLLRHGPIDRLLIGRDGRAPDPKKKPWKSCPECGEVVPLSCGVCLDCGHKFERTERELKHDGSAAAAAVLSEPEPVQWVSYHKHIKANAPEGHPPTLKVIYEVGLMQRPMEFVCLEHKGFARDKAVRWWKARTDRPVPVTIDEALRIIETHGLKEPKQIALQADGKYLRVAKAIGLEYKGGEEVPF